MDIETNVTPSPAGSDISATPTPSPATSDPNVAPPTTQVAPAPAARPQAQEGMVPSYRLRETREAAIREAQTQFAQREAIQQARYEAMQKQLHAVLGVTPQEDPEIAQVRTQFQRLYPGLSQLEQRAQDLMGVLERSGDFEAQVQHHWQSYGRQSIDRLFDLASKSLGGAPISDEGKQALHAAFSGYVASSPELTQRYASDPTLVDDFWRAFESNFIGPVRRTQAATIEQQTAPRNIPRDSPAPIAPVAAPAKPKDLDQAVAGAWSAFNAHKNASR